MLAHFFFFWSPPPLPPPRVLLSCPPELRGTVSLSVCVPSSPSGFCLTLGQEVGVLEACVGVLPLHTLPCLVKFPTNKCQVGTGLGQLMHALQATSTPASLWPSTCWFVPRLNTLSLTGRWFKYSCSRKTGLILAGMCWKL